MRTSTARVSRIVVRCGWCVLWAGAWISPQFAQTVVLQMDDPDLGLEIAGTGDLDGDGVGDIVANDPVNPGNLETVRLVSGSDGSPIHVFGENTMNAGYGGSLDGGLDLDGDGLPEVLIGASNPPPPGNPNGGAVYVYSGSTYGLLRVHYGPAGSRMGNTVRFLGDLNADGVSEYGAWGPAIGLWSPPSTVTIFDGLTGATLRTHVDPWLPGSDFGHGFDGVGDATGDGVDDYAIGAPFDGQFALEGGALYLYDGPTGQVAQSLFGTNPNARVGSKVSILREDWDGDGRMDFLAHGSGG